MAGVGGKIRETVARSASAPPAFKRPTGRERYPRRMTLDLDVERADWLRNAVWQAGPGSNGASLLRATIDELVDDAVLLARVVGRMKQNAEADRTS